MIALIRVIVECITHANVEVTSMQIAWNRINTLLLVLVLLVLAGALARGALGGPLDPPAPPASTMKTLDQVEPRIPISQPADATAFPIVISQPGSYYLTGNITGVAGNNGINVIAHDVTIDLNGFTLDGVVGSGYGVHSGGWNTTVRNGGVSSWGGAGIGLTAPNWKIDSVQVRSNTGDGIVAAAGGTISDSIASNNGGYGFNIGRGTIRNSYVASNGQGGIAVWAADVENNTVSANSNSGITANGPSVVQDNDVVANAIGISVLGNGAAVRDNTVAASTSGGILVNLAGNRIDGNQITGLIPIPITPYGIKVLSGVNFIVRNSATLNIDNFDIAAGNTTGPEETGTATSPWSNVNY